MGKKIQLSEAALTKIIKESVMAEIDRRAVMPGKYYEIFKNRIINAQHGSFGDVDRTIMEFFKDFKDRIPNEGFTPENLKDLAEKIDVDPKTLAETLNNWNKYVADQNDPDFGRTTGMKNDLSQAPYYAIKIAPGIHHTMGGVHINTSAEVIDKEGNAIPGLFAAGEVVGGVHGGNRIGGNAVADIVVFGKIASDSAVEWCDQN